MGAGPTWRHPAPSLGQGEERTPHSLLEHSLRTPGENRSRAAERLYPCVCEGPQHTTCQNSAVGPVPLLSSPTYFKLLA